MGQCCWWTKAQEGHNQAFDDTDARGLELQKMTQHELDQISKEGIRCGATINPERRSKEYARDGYQGVMYYAETKNMKTAENKLLHDFNYKYNEQTNSNVQQKKGFVYIITGKKL